MAEIVETIESEDRRRRAEIVRRSDGLLQVLVFRWTEGAAPDPGKLSESWAPHGKATSFFDDIDAARKAARELLAVSEGAR